MKFRENLIILISLVMLLLMILLFFINSKIIVDSIFIIAFFKILIIDGIKYYKPSVSFVLPWIVLYLFQKINITIYARDMDFLTWKLISVPVLLSSILAPEFFKINLQIENDRVYFNFSLFKYALFTCYSLFIV